MQYQVKVYLLKRLISTEIRGSTFIWRESKRWVLVETFYCSTKREANGFISSRLFLENHKCTISALKGGRKRV